MKKGKQMRNPCQSCGACCTLYKVAVLNSEIDAQIGGGVPVDLTVPLKSGKRLMKGTETFRKRCVALTGTPGSEVACGIYEQRPLACRSFSASWDSQNGGNPLCDRARALYGMLAYEGF